MTRSCMPAVAAVALGAAVLTAPAAAEGRRVSSPDLDRVVVHVDRIPAQVPLAFRRFDASDADLGTGSNPKKRKKHEAARAMQRAAPPVLEAAFVAESEESGTFESVTVLDADEEVPEGAVLVEGRFTLLNPGSRGKRAWIGLGAGKSKICLEGRVLTPDGDEAATFEHCRSGTMGFYGGRAEGLMATDVTQTGERIADFVRHLAQGIYRER